mmetsp:Transcript_5670/g.11768  ORF Transcript_5670/g.11768 Transcript_5670/m.11768 type:complete len:314 (+) Transcript_5670:2129-3070(+)
MPTQAVLASLIFSEAALTASATSSWIFSTASSCTSMFHSSTALVIGSPALAALLLSSSASAMILATGAAALCAARRPCTSANLRLAICTLVCAPPPAPFPLPFPLNPLTGAAGAGSAAPCKPSIAAFSCVSFVATFLATCSHSSSLMANFPPTTSSWIFATISSTSLASNPTDRALLNASTDFCAALIRLVAAVTRDNRVLEVSWVGFLSLLASSSILVVAPSASCKVLAVVAVNVVVAFCTSGGASSNLPVDSSETKGWEILMQSSTAASTGVTASIISFSIVRSWKRLSADFRTPWNCSIRASRAFFSRCH